MKAALHPICVGALISNNDRGGSILLGHRSGTRSFFPNVWDLPRGHCEPGESLEQALVRELEEEVGITPTAWRLLGDLTVGVPDSYDSVCLCEVSTWTGAPVNKAPEEYDQVAWFSIDEACNLALAHPGYPDWFRRLATR